MNIYQTDHTKTPEIFTLIKEKKNEDAKRYLKENPAEIFLKGWMDDTPLHIASLSGNFEMVKYLVENGAKVNAERSGIYATPLCWADNFEIAKYLLDNGATLNDKELYLATRQDKTDIVDLLLSKGAKIDSEEPQYLICSSILCIKVYLKHNVKIDGFDNQDSNLLHKLSWLDIPEVFDFAYKNGCPWQKDSSQRTPYYLAKQGRRENILKHFKENYSELISHKIENTSTDNYEFERVLFLKQSPTKSDWFIGLTKNAKLVKYLLTDGELVIDRIATINVSTIRNFSFDKNGNIVIPTADNKLLIVEQITFQLLHSIKLEDDLVLDQIEFLPLKKIFLGSSQNWEIVLLSQEYKVISRISTHNGTIVPLINQDESMISFLSYDQETYYDLYTIDNDLKISFIHTFFKDWNNVSSGFCFRQNEFAVSFPSTLEYYSIDKEELNKKWEIDISRYKSEHYLSYLANLDDNTIAVGKGKTLLIVNITNQTISNELKLNLSAEIRDLYIDKDKEILLVSTDKELKIIQLKEKNWAQQGIAKSGAEGFLTNIWNKFKGRKSNEL
ncbi:MAG: ankyrin repeat domain-containing protein [Bacteroidia bacterium]